MSALVSFLTVVVVLHQNLVSASECDDVAEATQQELCYLRERLEQLEASHNDVQCTVDQLDERMTRLHSDTACKSGYEYHPLVGCLLDLDDIPITPISRDTAKERCDNDGTHLVIVDSPEVHDIIANKLTKKVRREDTPETWIRIWTDLVLVGDEWEWESSSELLAWSNWWPGEPQHYGEDCMSMNFLCNATDCSGGNWSDYMCDNVFRPSLALCQHSPWQGED